MRDKQHKIRLFGRRVPPLNIRWQRPTGEHARLVKPERLSQRRNADGLPVRHDGNHVREVRLSLRKGAPRTVRPLLQRPFGWHIRKAQVQRADCFALRRADDQRALPGLKRAPVIPIRQAAQRIVPPLGGKFALRGQFPRLVRRGRGGFIRQRAGAFRRAQGAQRGAEQQARPCVRHALPPPAQREICLPVM